VEYWEDYDTYEDLQSAVIAAKKHCSFPPFRWKIVDFNYSTIAEGKGEKQL
jgi:hypothetical protein